MEAAEHCWYMLLDVNCRRTGRTASSEQLQQEHAAAALEGNIVQQQEKSSSGVEESGTPMMGYYVYICML
jgi:hypothetical protein